MGEKGSDFMIQMHLLKRLEKAGEVFHHCEDFNILRI